jgi:3',5'-cyclic AMP phosphodiesterase CpdA
MASTEIAMSSDQDDGRGVSRRKILECMTWAGTGVLWTVAGGMPRSMGIIGEATAAPSSGLTFLQISDSHVGFDKPANPNAIGTLEEAINKIKTLPLKPSFVIHTGDITHLSKPSEFDDADRIIAQARLDVHYVPGEHDFLDEGEKLYRERYGRGAKGAGWYSFDANGVHFIGLVNVVNLKAGGLGNLGNEQLEWLEDDLKGRAASTPIVVFAHIPLWTVYQQWGWGTDDGARALDYLKHFGSVTVLNGHIHQIMQKVEGNVTFHTAMSTAFPQPAPGTAPSPGPMNVPDDKLRSLLGVTDVTFKRGQQRLAIIDKALQG